jgi:hypothetical protein
MVALRERGLPLPACGHIDMHKGMNGLALQVRQALQRDPYAGDPYVFRGSDSVLWPRAEDFGSVTTWAAIWGASAVAKTRIIFGARYELPTASPCANLG